jgi:glyoxylase-like metal-dependent hydrolase (beta-lactamase superfamily II)
MEFGEYRLCVVPDTEFRLDGGAMFGVVPRTLWSRVAPPDGENRVRLNMNCLFIDTGAEKILIDTGIGEKFTEKQRAIYAIDRKRSFEESLKAIAGVDTDEITIVINTHLHFDHAGGNTELDSSGSAVPAFRNARYMVSRLEHEHAEAPSERDRASYFPDNWRPLISTGQLELREADYEVAPGIRMETHAGHNRSMQCLRVERGGQTLFGFADLVPTQAHVGLAWIMGYDLFPVETLEAKKRLLPQAARDNWLCWFYHDSDAPLGRIVEKNGKFEMSPDLN